MEWSLSFSLVWSLLAVLLATVLLYCWFVYPGTVLRHLTNIAIYFLGIKRKKVRVGDLVLSYAERGHRKSGVTSLFFIHGFSADKNMYLPLLRYLPRRQHMILLDLPGHGESDIPDESSDLSLHGMTQLIKQFVDKTKLNEEPFHIIGTSLGGAMSAVYSAVHPDDVAKTTLVCPAMLTPIETDFQRDTREGKCFLLGNTVDEVATIMKKCLHRRYFFLKNKQVLRGISQQRASQTHYYDRVFQVISRSMNQHQDEYMERVRSIRAPTQVIWGKGDQLVHVSGAEVLKQNLPHCPQVDILERCGHVVSFDRPRHMAKVLRQFMAYEASGSQRKQ